MPTTKKTYGKRLPRGRNGGIELMLIQDVDHLGKQGDVVSVRPGYANNYLLPQALATVATEHHKRMVEKQDNVYYYITLLNENYAMPGLTAGTEEQIIKGMYLCKPASNGNNSPVVGAGTSSPRSGGGTKVRLTESQVRLAERMGVPLEVYAREYAMRNSA